MNATPCRVSGFHYGSRFEGASRIEAYILSAPPPSHLLFVVSAADQPAVRTTAAAPASTAASSTKPVDVWP